MIEPFEIQEAVRKKYGEVAHEIKGRFNYPTGKEGLLKMGYPISVVRDVADEILHFFCGVGNPFSLGKFNEGAVLLDIGCGAGVDLIFAGRLAGSFGQVFGIDITEKMAEKARRNLVKTGINNGTVKLAPSEEIPFEDNFFDVIISNGVLNLSPLKEKTFREIYRVIKPGGKLQFADIILKKDLPEEVIGSLEAWSD